MTKIVAGIGTRHPPTDDADLNETMRVFCYFAVKMGWHLRSGAAIGMDSWFERLWDNNKEIFIAKERISGKTHGVDGANFVEGPQEVAAFNIMKKIHPAGPRLKGIAKAMHTRNIFQILGEDLNTPADLIVYYAKFDDEGKEITGGTRTAVVLGKQRGINEFNLILPDERTRLLEYIGQEYDNFTNAGNVGS